VSGPVVERSTSNLPTIYEPFEHLPVRTDLLQEWHEVGEEDVAGIGAGGIVVGVGALAVDQGQVTGRDVRLPGQEARVLEDRRPTEVAPKA